MDTTYYVHIPNSEAPTAEVDSSSTKHARTIYLDYLSRNRLISWGERQRVRPLIKVSRMQPGEIRTQVQLDYRVGELPVQEVEAPPEVEPEEESAAYRGARYGDRYGEYPFEDKAAEAERYSESSRSRVAPPELVSASVGEGVSPGLSQSLPGRPAPSPDSPIARLSKRSKGV